MSLRSNYQVLRFAREARLAPTGSRHFRLSHPPNPNWKLGEGASRADAGTNQWNADLKQGWTTWDTAEMPGKSVQFFVYATQSSECASRDAYQLLTSAVIPRPIAFVSTVSMQGAPNLAPMRPVTFHCNTVPCR